LIQQNQERSQEWLRHPTSGVLGRPHRYWDNNFPAYGFASPMRVQLLL
jgi:hypothetical protein